MKGRDLVVLEIRVAAVVDKPGDIAIIEGIDRVAALW